MRLLSLFCLLLIAFAARAQDWQPFPHVDTYYYSAQLDSAHTFEVYPIKVLQNFRQGSISSAKLDSTPQTSNRQRFPNCSGSPAYARGTVLADSVATNYSFSQFFCATLNRRSRLIYSLPLRLAPGRTFVFNSADAINGVIVSKAYIPILDGRRDSVITYFIQGHDTVQLSKWNGLLGAYTWTPHDETLSDPHVEYPLRLISSPGFVKLKAKSWWELLDADLGHVFITRADHFQVQSGRPEKYAQTISRYLITASQVNQAAQTATLTFSRKSIYQNLQTGNTIVDSATGLTWSTPDTSYFTNSPFAPERGLVDFAPHPFLDPCFQGSCIGTYAISHYYPWRTGFSFTQNQLIAVKQGGVLNFGSFDFSPTVASLQQGQYPCPPTYGHVDMSFVHTIGNGIDGITGRQQVVLGFFMPYSNTSLLCHSRPGQIRFCPPIDTYLSAKGKSNTLHASLAPNPASRSTRLSLSLPANGSIHATLSDLSGKSVRNWTLPGRAGANEETLGLVGISPGLYALHIVTPQGMQSMRIVLE